MVHHVAISLDIALLSGGLSHSDALRAVPDQERQPFPAPGIPLFVMTGKGQHDDQLNIVVLRLLLQPEYDFSGPLIYSEASTHQKPVDAFFLERDKLVVHPLLQPFAAIIVLIILPFESCWPVSSDGTGM